MRLKKLRRSIEQMPRPAYIFLKVLLILSAAMLTGSCLLFVCAGRNLALLHLAVLLLESPAGILMLGVIGLALILDRS